MATQPTITIISYEGEFQSRKDEFYNEWSFHLSYFNKTQLRKQLKKAGYELPPRKKIKYVFAMVRTLDNGSENPNFKPIQNKAVKYEYGIFVNEEWDGAEMIWEEGNPFNGKYVSYHPYGDIIVVI